MSSENPTVLDELTRLDARVNSCNHCLRILQRVQAPQHEITRIHGELLAAQAERASLEAMIDRHQSRLTHA